LKVLRALQPSSGSPNGNRAGQLYQELHRRQQVGDCKQCPSNIHVGWCSGSSLCHSVVLQG
jgi:hypothetical protein